MRKEKEKKDMGIRWPKVQFMVVARFSETHDPVGPNVGTLVICVNLSVRELWCVVK